MKEVYNLKGKCNTLTTCAGGNLQKKVYQNGRCRKLTPLEYERLQTLPDGYTEGVADTHRYNSIGNGWTVDVIAHIFTHLKELEKVQYTDNPLADFEAYEWERERHITKLPRCSHCDEHITDDTAFYIEGEWICEDCMNQFRKVVESES